MRRLVRRSSTVGFLGLVALLGGGALAGCGDGRGDPAVDEAPEMPARGDAGTGPGKIVMEKPRMELPPPMPMPTPMPDPENPLSEQPSPDAPLPPGIVESALDVKAPPCEDFYRYACGGYIDKTMVSANGSTSIIASASAQSGRILTEVLDGTVAGKPPAGMPLAKEIADLYGACADEPALEKELPALKAELAKLEGIADTAALGTALGALHAEGTAVLFRFGPEVDTGDATKVIGGIAPAGLTLEVASYDGTDAAALKARAALETLVGSFWKALGDTPEKALEKAKAIVAIETGLAATLPKMSGGGTPVRTSSQAQLVAQMTAFPWGRFFSAAGVSNLSKILLRHPAYFDKAGVLLGSQDIASWRAYLGWHKLRSLESALPKAFTDALFTFRMATTGSSSRASRKNTCSNFAVNTLPEAIAVGFVSRFEGEKIRAEALSMMKEIEAQFTADLMAQSWMDEATRAKAIDKVNKVANKIGYPDMPLDYKGLTIDRASHLGNVLRARKWVAARTLAQFGKPVDRTSWTMRPWTVNASYSPTRNEMTFPLAILQPPFFSLMATEPMNYGGIGTIMGHELTHGFDNKGRNFDGGGSLASWWTPEADAAFRDRAMCIEKQFGEYKIAEMAIDGRRTLGENIADLGGLKLAFKAMQARRAKNPDMGKGSRYTIEQQFFISYAQHSCAKAGPGSVANWFKGEDPHAPWEFRVNGSLANFPAFSDAFQCKPGQKMVRAMRCELW